MPWARRAPPGPHRTAMHREIELRQPAPWRTPNGRRPKALLHSPWCKAACERPDAIARSASVTVSPVLGLTRRMAPLPSSRHQRGPSRNRAHGVRRMVPEGLNRLVEG